MRRFAIATAAVALIALAGPRVFACGDDSADKAKTASAEGSASCSAKHADHAACAAHHESNVSAKDVVAQPGAKNGDVTKCPVNDEVFKVASKSARVKVAGSTYVVCCKECAVALKKDPKKYLNKA